MNKRATVSADGEMITIHVPLTFRNRGGRKLVVTPDGAVWEPAELQLDDLLEAFPLEWEGQFGLICGDRIDWNERGAKALFVHPFGQISLMLLLHMLGRARRATDDRNNVDF